MKRIFCIKLLLASALSLIFAGCSVLTVDVDVYKGPLVNTPHVQGEQAIAMAMAAKPVLVELRDHLAITPVGPQKVGVGSAPTLEEQLKCFRKRLNYNPGYMATKLNTELAVRANELLGLYDDSFPAGFGEALQAAQRSLDLYSQSRIGLQAGNAADEKLWKQVVAGKPPMATNNQELFSAYKNIVAPDPDTNSPYYGTGFRFGVKERLPKEDRWRNSSNHAYEELAKTLMNTNTDSELSALVPSDQNMRTELRDRLNGLAVKFRLSREYLAEALSSGLVMMDSLDTGLVSPSNQVLNHQRNLLARFNSQLIDPKRIRDIMTNDMLAALRTPNIARLHEHLGKVPGYFELQSDRMGMLLAPLLASGIMRNLESDAGGGLVKDLLVAHRATWASLPSAAGSNPFFKYGLANGPVDNLTESKNLLDNLSAVASAASSLQKGRPTLGIATLVDQYLAQEAINRGENPLRHQVMDALLNFAQKVVFLGNSAGLTRGSHQQEVQSYTRVLQAIGNSILVQVDELDQQEFHRRKQTDRREHVALSVSKAFTSSANVPTSRPEAKDVLEDLQTLLRLEHAKVTQTGSGSGAAVDPLARAIEEVTELKSGMIYLRPASSYLRSSYPATTLARNDSQTWHNMLLEHGLRQSPLTSWAANGGSSEQLRLLREIDRQSWQNVNRVRVASPGRGNQVVVKDDVGNWYIKRFDGNTESIANSARNLAMFAAGGSFGAKLPVRNQAGQLLAAPDSVVARQMKDIQEKVRQETTNNLHSVLLLIADDVEGIQKRLAKLVSQSEMEQSDKESITTRATTSSKFMELTNSLPRISKDLKDGKTPADHQAVADKSIYPLLSALRRTTVQIAEIISSTNKLPSIEKASKAVADAVTQVKEKEKGGDTNEIAQARDKEASEREKLQELAKKAATLTGSLSKDFVSDVRGQLDRILQRQEEFLREAETGLRLVEKGISNGK